MTMRQTVITVLGFLCAEMARVIHEPDTVDSTLYTALTKLTMATKFRHRNIDRSTNLFDAWFSDTVKISGPAFSHQGALGLNEGDLDDMEWLDPEDTSLPRYITDALRSIGDVKNEVRNIMLNKRMRYNRVLFLGPLGKIKFATLFANSEYMIHAPMMVPSNMRIFTNSQNQSYGSLKLSRWGCYYQVKIFSNRCVNTNLYVSTLDRDTPYIDGGENTLSKMVQTIKNEVSSVDPKIDVRRIKMMASELNAHQFRELISTLEKNKIRVIGREGHLASNSESCPGELHSDGAGSVCNEYGGGTKRSRDALYPNHADDENDSDDSDQYEDNDGTLERKRVKFDDELTMCEPCLYAE